MADQVNPWANVPLTEAIPFGAGATPEGSPTVLSNMISGLFGMPKELIDSAKKYDPADPHGSIDRMIPASTQTAMALTGTGAPAAEAGAAGIFGGKLAKTADIKALIEANKMHKADKPMGQIWGDTGWFRSPTDGKWRFEISDHDASMQSHGLDYSKDGSFVKGPARAMFDHPELFEAYPQFKNTTMYNTSLHNPQNGVGRGSFDPNTFTSEIEAPDLLRSTNVGLHELQHGVQTIENFAPGGNPRSMAYLLEKKPNKLPMFEQQSHPDDLYHRLAGEVESRNVQDRMEFKPEHRQMVSPWETHDVKYKNQLVFNPLTELVRALRNDK